MITHNRYYNRAKRSGRLKLMEWYKLHEKLRWWKVRLWHGLRLHTKSAERGRLAPGRLASWRRRPSQTPASWKSKCSCTRWGRPSFLLPPLLHTWNNAEDPSIDNCFLPHENVLLLSMLNFFVHITNHSVEWLVIICKLRYEVF